MNLALYSLKARSRLLDKKNEGVFGMGKESNHYEVIRKIIAEHLKPPYTKDDIKTKIVAALEGEDYIAAVTAYLWGAYNSFDPDARLAFKEIFFNDLRIHNQAAFYFFSFYFMNDFKRTGFDRRTDNDRREAYSLDFFSERIVDRRQGIDRRSKQEKRLNWTRVTEWVSVPFKVDDVSLGGDRADSLPEDRRLRLDKGMRRPDAEIDIQSLNAILSSLIIYFDSYVRQGQTEWLNGLNQEIFQRAQDVMLSLLEIQKASQQ